MPVAAHIRAELEQVLAGWNAGKPIGSPELGHSQQMQQQPDEQHRIVPRDGDPHDQAQLYGYAFHLIELFLLNGLPVTHEGFLGACREYEAVFEEKLEPSAVEAVESLVWKALMCGWARTIDGHKDAQYITVKKPRLK